MAKRQFTEQHQPRKKDAPVEKPVPEILAAVTLDVTEDNLKQPIKTLPTFHPRILGEASRKALETTEDLTIGQWINSKEVETKLSAGKLTLEQEGRLRTIQIPIAMDARLDDDQLQQLKNTIAKFFKDRGIILASMDDFYTTLDQLAVATDPGISDGKEIARVLEFRLKKEQPISVLGVNGDKLAGALIELSEMANKARKRGTQIE